MACLQFSEEREEPCGSLFVGVFHICAVPLQAGVRAAYNTVGSWDDGWASGRVDMGKRDCRDSSAHEPLTALTLGPFPRPELHPEGHRCMNDTPEWHTAHILGYYAHRAAPS